MAIGDRHSVGIVQYGVTLPKSKYEFIVEKLSVLKYMITKVKIHLRKKKISETADVT